MTAICDTGPLVAFLNRHDPHHTWAVEIMKQVTCAAVLTEVVYFLREDGLDVDPVFQLLERTAAHFEALETRRALRLMSTCRLIGRACAHAWHATTEWISDASLVVMAELHPRAPVLTVDRTDFSICRRNDRQVIVFVAPPKA